jgi:hypothetical protein
MVEKAEFFRLSRRAPLQALLLSSGFICGMVPSLVAEEPAPTVVLVNPDVTDTLRVAILTSIPVLARMFGTLRDSLGVIQEPCGASA